MDAHTITLSISGMSCGHCVTAVTESLAAVPGVTVRDVTIGQAVIDVDRTVTQAQLASAVEDAGYALDPASESIPGDLGAVDGH
jgi:copper chaperone CopZ